MSQIPTIAVQNTMSIGEFLQSLNFANGAQIQPKPIMLNMFNMVLVNGEQMYFAGLEFNSSNPNIPRALDEAVTRIREAAAHFTDPDFPSMVTFVLIVDDKVTVLELDVADERSNIRYEEDSDSDSDSDEEIGNYKLLCSDRFLGESQERLILPSMVALNPQTTPPPIDRGIFLSLKDGESLFASGIVSRCLTDAFDKHQS